jgi:hypothetical protein
MGKIVFGIEHEPTNCLVREIFRTLPAQERKNIESIIATVGGLLLCLGCQEG